MLLNAKRGYSLQQVSITLLAGGTFASGHLLVEKAQFHGGSSTLLCEWQPPLEVIGITAVVFEGGRRETVIQVEGALLHHVHYTAAK